MQYFYSKFLIDWYGIDSHGVISLIFAELLCPRQHMVAIDKCSSDINAGWYFRLY